MKMAKKIVTGSLVSACAMIAAPAALAASYTVGGSANGTGTMTGPTIVVLTTGGSLACTSTFTVKATAGVGTVTGATFSGATGCSTTTAQGLPWSIAAPTSATGPNNVKINGISVFVAGGVNKTCTGSVTGTLDGTGKFTFAGNLTPNCIARTNPANTQMVSSPAMLAVYP